MLDLADTFERIGKVKHAQITRTLYVRCDRVRSLDRNLRKALESSKSLRSLQEKNRLFWQWTQKNPIYVGTTNSVSNVKKSMNAVADNLWDTSVLLYQRKHIFSFRTLQDASSRYRVRRRTFSSLDDCMSLILFWSLPGSEQENWYVQTITF